MEQPPRGGHRGKDPAKQAQLRNGFPLCRLLSRAASTPSRQTGEMIIAIRLGEPIAADRVHVQNLISLSGPKRYNRRTEDAMKRLREYVVPLERAHEERRHGRYRTRKDIHVLNASRRFMGRKVRVILVGEKLGF